MPIATSVDFYKLLAELKSSGQKFSPKTLKLLSYDQLILAAMGNAGSCRCSIDDVTNEKQERRAHLVPLSEEELQEMGLGLHLLADVLEDKQSINHKAPAWSELSTTSKLYFKLTCLETHPYDAVQRTSEVISLFKDAGSALPQQLAFSLRMEFQSSILSKPSDEWIRDTSTKACNILYGFIPGPEIEIVDKLELRDYSCTAGCFYPTS